MPVYGADSPVAEGLRRRPNLPTPPTDDKRILPYLALLDKAIADSYEELARRLQSHVSFSLSVPFGASDTDKIIAFISPLEDDAYTPLMVPTWDTRLWVSAVSITGFTIHASDPPGGSGGTVRVAIIR